MSSPFRAWAGYPAAIVILGAALTLGTAAAPAEPYLAWVTNLADGTVSVVDLDSLAVAATYDVGKKPRGIAAVPGEPVVAVAVQGTGKVVSIHATQGVLDDYAVGRKPYDLAVDPVDKSWGMVALAGERRLLYIDDNGPQGRIAVGKRPVSVAFDGKGQLLAVLNKGDASVTLLTRAELLAGAPARSTVLGVGVKPALLAVHRNGREAAITSPASGTVTLIDPKRGVIDDVIQLAGAPWGGAYSPSDNNVAAVSLSRAGKLVLFVRDEMIEIPVGRKPRAVAFSPDGKLIVVANTGSGSVTVINVRKRSVIGTVGVGRKPYGVVITPANDGRSF